MAHEYRLLLADEEYFKKTCLDTRLAFPPTLTSVLQSHSPPSLDFFRSLNADASRDKVWGIYIVLMEKTGDKPKLYVGSGTSRRGVRHRILQYRRGNTLSVRRVVNAYQSATVPFGCWEAWEKHNKVRSLEQIPAVMIYGVY